LAASSPRSRRYIRMNPSLFKLISTAGAASLDELRARSPVDGSVLTRDIVQMLSEGVVALSLDPDFPKPGRNEVGFQALDPEGVALLDKITSAEPTSQMKLVADKDTLARLTRVFQSILKVPSSAYGVIVSPTSYGFRIAGR
jgi:hypothetical protein